jgi:hypothetical protein
MLLADLSGELADAKLEVANLKTQLADAVEENKALSALIAQRATTKPILAGGVYKFEGEEGVFCTACFDTQEKRVRLSRLTEPFTAFGT